MSSASLLYRISSAFLVLFALGHTIGFRRVDPRWNADSVINGMRSVNFHVQGFDRSYWDFFSGFGFFVSVFLAFAAILAWQFGSMSPGSVGDSNCPVVLCSLLCAHRGPHLAILLSSAGRVLHAGGAGACRRCVVRGLTLRRGSRVELQLQ
jgi:hypothetical protein